MPIPFIVAAASAVAAVVGAKAAVDGGKKMKEAKDTMLVAQSRHQKNMGRCEEQNRTTTIEMDRLGKYEMSVLSSFKEFSDTFEKIHNRPDFAAVTIGDVTIPKYDGAAIKQVSIGAGVLAGGLGGAALGTAGGFAAAGATTAAVMAFGAASTGTAISTLSGAALANATLAALGGGAIAAGGGGIALGTTILGVATAGVGLLVGGLIFNLAGSKLSNKADEAYEQMRSAEIKINRICTYLGRLSTAANDYCNKLIAVDSVYRRYLSKVKELVNEKNDWNDFSSDEKKLVENTVLLVGVLYEMCKVKLIVENKDVSQVNEVNTADIAKATKQSSVVLDSIC